MEFDMRAKIFLCAWVIGLFLFHRTAHAQPTPERINAIYASIAGDHAALYVAQEMGLFRKYGLDVNLSYIAGAAQVPVARTLDGKKYSHFARLKSVVPGK